MIDREIKYNIACDTCGTEYEWHSFDSIRDAVQVIRDNGWGVKRGRGGVVTFVACPRHNDFDNGD